MSPGIRHLVGAAIGSLALVASLANYAEDAVVLKLRQIASPPRAAGYHMVDDTGQPILQVSLHTTDGLTLSGWYIAPQNGAVVILQHGYAANSAQMRPVALMLARHGFGALLFDFRGHGNSEGDFVTFGLHEVLDTEAAVAFLLAQPEVDPERIAVIGNSMGGATAILAAAENQHIRAVVAEGTFAEIKDIETGVRLVNILSRAPFDPMINRLIERRAGFNLDAIAPVKRVGDIGPRPVLILQGGADQRIFAHNGEKLFASAQEPKELWFEPSVAHMAFYRTLPELYEQRIIAFLDRYVLGLGAY